MDAFTEARQTLGKVIAKVMREHDTSAHMSIGRYHFFARGTGGSDQNYVFEMGWEKDSNRLGVFAVRRKWNGWEDAVSDQTTIDDLKECLKYMPVAEKLMEIESATDESI